MMNVIINGHKYVPIKTIIDTLQMALKDERQDCMTEEEESGFDLAEKRMLKTLYKIGRSIDANENFEPLN